MKKNPSLMKSKATKLKRHSAQLTGMKYPISYRNMKVLITIQTATSNMKTIRTKLNTITRKRKKPHHRM